MLGIQKKVDGWTKGFDVSCSSPKVLLELGTITNYVETLVFATNNASLLMVSF